MKISYCIPSKNNLRYLKGSIKSIKENSSLPYEIVVFIDSNGDGTEEWLKKNAPEVKYTKNTSYEYKGIAYGYNRCIENATGDVICVFHADMYMGKGFDTNLIKHLKPNTVVAATRIEPPLHPAGKEKIVMPFGMYPEDFDKKAFDDYVEDIKVKNMDVTTKGIFAPWMTYKKNLTEIGMHDETLHITLHVEAVSSKTALKSRHWTQSFMKCETDPVDAILENGRVGSRMTNINIP